MSVGQKNANIRNQFFIFVVSLLLKVNTGANASDSISAPLVTEVTALTTTYAFATAHFKIIFMRRIKQHKIFFLVKIL